MKKIAVIGTLDTKATEFHYLKSEIEKNGSEAIVFDVGILSAPGFKPDYTREQIAAAGGIEVSLAETAKGEALTIMAKGAASLIRSLYKAGKLDGAISMGGGQGTFLGMGAMSELPIGVPKVMVSTLALVVKELFTGGKDTMIVDPIVDIAGLNSMLKVAIQHAAGAVCGMVKSAEAEIKPKKPVITTTMYGVTTKCVDIVRQILEPKGYELWAFHSTGIGGPNMEALIRGGFIAGTIDLTIAEVSQTLLGGTCATIPTRLEAAGDMGLPQVISPGGVDVVNFLGKDSIPEKYRNKNRVFHMHNPTTTLMRSNSEEAVEIAKIVAGKLNKAKGPVKVLLPLKGISEYDKDGGVWYDKEADHMLFETLKEHLSNNIEVVEKDLHINDPEFAKALAEQIDFLLKK